MAALPIAAGYGVDNTSLILDALNNIQVNPANPLVSNVPVTTVFGTVGSYTWCQPVRGSSWKKVIIRLNGYTALAGSPITFTQAFTYTPAVLSNTTGLTLGILSATSLTIPVATLASGFIILEGF